MPSSDELPAVSRSGAEVSLQPARHAPADAAEAAIRVNRLRRSIGW